MIGNDDDGALQGDLLAKVDIARNSQMVQLDDVGNGSEPLEEVRDLLEVAISELDEGGGEEHPVGIH